MSGIFWNPEVSARSRAPELSTQAVVIDVIRNEEHPEYGRTGFTVGTVRFKYLRSTLAPGLSVDSDPHGV